MQNTPEGNHVLGMHKEKGQDCPDPAKSAKDKIENHIVATCSDGWVDVLDKEGQKAIN